MTGPTSLRYPKATAERIDRKPMPIELGRAEVLDWGHDCMIIACGTLLGDCTRAAATLRGEGLDVGVINARFIKPLDTETILRAIETASLVVTVEEGALPGGFGSAVLEAAATPACPPLTSGGWACPIAMSSMASAASCWPTWGWTRPASRRRCRDWATEAQLIRSDERQAG